MDTVPTREELLEVFRGLVQKGVQNPYDVLYSKADPEAVKITALYEAWLGQERPMGTVDEQIHYELLEHTLLFDAGFTDPDFLDEVAYDWLMNTLSLAITEHRRDLAKVVQEKINEVEKKMQEQDPSHPVTDFSVWKHDWNPPRGGGPEAFYPDYAYWKGPEAVDMNEALKEYMRLHPTEDPATVREGLEKAAREYKETA